MEELKQASKKLAILRGHKNLRWKKLSSPGIRVQCSTCGYFGISRDDGTFKGKIFDVNCPGQGNWKKTSWPSFP